MSLHTIPLLVAKCQHNCSSDLSNLLFLILHYFPITVFVAFLCIIGLSVFWIYMVLTRTSNDYNKVTALSIWSVVGSFLVQEMAITSLIPVF